MASLKQTQIYGALRIYNAIDENTTFENTISIDPEENGGKLTFSDDVYFGKTINISDLKLSYAASVLNINKNVSLAGYALTSKYLNTESINVHSIAFTGNTGTISGLKTLSFETGSPDSNSVSNLFALGMTPNGVINFGTGNKISTELSQTGGSYFKLYSHHLRGGIRIGCSKSGQEDYVSLSYNGTNLNIDKPLVTKNITIQSGTGYSTTLSASNNDNTLHLNGGITINPSVAGEDTNQTIITNSSVATTSLSAQLIKTGTNNILISGTDDVSTTATFGVAIGDNITTFRGIGAVAIGPETKAIAGAISIGRSSNATGQNSIAIGARNTSSKVATTADGTGSIAIGAQSSINGVGMNGAQAHGEASIAIGVNSQTNSNYNIAIGMGANVGNTAEGGIALGAGASCSTTNALELPSEYKVYADGVITTSDKQDKTDIKNLTNNYTPFLMDLEPVTYRFNYRNNYTVENPDPKFRNKYGISEYDKIEHAKATKANSRTHVGFIAQDVKSTIEKHFPNNDHLDIINIAKIDTGEFQKGEIEPGYERYYMNYSAMIPVLVKVLQEQQEEINNLKSEIEKLKK